jgi:hypothetical protein
MAACRGVAGHRRGDVRENEPLDHVAIADELLASVERGSRCRTDAKAALPVLPPVQLSLNRRAGERQERLEGDVLPEDFPLIAGANGAGEEHRDGHDEEQGSSHHGKRECREGPISPITP